jgi:hypothetical protein
MMREKTRLVVCILICLSSALLVVPFIPASSYSSPTSNFLSGVWCSGYGYWAVGSSGTILSYNSANNWEVWSPSVTSASLSSVFMQAINDGWIVGSTSGPGTSSTILHYYRDSGGTGHWVSVSSPTTNPLTDVWALSATNAWAVGQNTIIHWNGVSWSTVSMPTSTTLWAIHMVSSSAGWAVGGSGTILRYNGFSWSIVPTPTTALLLDVYMLSTTDGWATGAGGTILHWNGASWQSVTSPTTESLYGVTMTSATSGYAVGGEALNGDGTLLRWDGTRWRQATIATSNTLTSVDMVNDNIGGWAVGHAGTIVRIPTEITVQYELTVNVVGSGTTSVGSGWHNAGSTVSVDAQPSSGWTLDHWELDSVDVGDADPRSVTMNADHTLTAVFVQIPQHTLTIAVTGSGTTSPAPGSTQRNEGSTVSVDAQPSAGWTLDHWELDSVNVGTADPYSVTMNTDHTLTAVFVEIPPTQYQLTISVTGTGSTSPSPGTTSHTAGSTVSVDAQPSTGWTLDHWELDGANVGAADPYSVTMNAAHTLTAVFVEVPVTQYTLTITTATGSGTTSPLPGSTPYNEGTDVIVNANPETGWTLDHWELDSVDVGDTNPYTVTMDMDHTLTAVFVETAATQYQLTITVSGSGSTSPGPGTTTHDEGDTVSVDAQPSAGWTLDHWELDSVDVGDTSPYTVTMDDDHELLAVFTGGEEESYVLTTGVEGTGTLDFPPGTYEFSAGEEVTVTATPAGNWTLDHWVLDGEETDAGLTLTVEMTTNHEVIAIFTETGGTTETPTAAAGPDQTVTVNTTVVFDATNSSDDEGIVTYEWDFGDDTTGTGAVTTHTYTTPGTYVVTLTVEDAQENQDEDVLIVTVEAAAGGFQLEWWMFIAALALVIGLAATIYLARR